ncbi:MAG: cysteine desulfurase family protein [Anaerolineales bacterium]|jgi:cysteine desulfurase
MSDLTYFDYAATTPVDARVLEAMLPYFGEMFGNPSSVHRQGQRAEAAVEEARETVAAGLHCDPGEVVFTSCGTESDNLAIRGAAVARRAATGANRIITSRAEHHAVSRTAEQLEKLYGFQVDWLETDEYGMITPQAVEQAITRDTVLVSVMAANNEIGTYNPLPEIGAVCRAHAVPFHSDAVQAAAYLPLDVNELGVDLLSLGAHKFYGPKGIGALFVRKGTLLLPAQTGGGQEGGLRAGTQNVPYIVGFAEAFRFTCGERDRRGAHVRPLRDQIIGRVLEEIPDSRLTGHPELRLPNHASFAFKDMDGDLLMTLLDAAGFACSSGSACKTGNPEPSEVMAAIGLPPQWGLGSLRITLGKDSTAAQVEAFLDVLPGLVQKARALNQRCTGIIGE